MTVDYYSLLMKAVAGKDAVARDQIYQDAFSVIANPTCRARPPHRMPPRSRRRPADRG